jgi:hypothetical protein
MSSLGSSARPSLATSISCYLLSLSEKTVAPHMSSYGMTITVRKEIIHFVNMDGDVSEEPTTQEKPYELTFMLLEGQFSFQDLKKYHEDTSLSKRINAQIMAMSVDHQDILAPLAGESGGIFMLTKRGHVSMRLLLQALADGADIDGPGAMSRLQQLVSGVHDNMVQSLLS